MFKLNRHSKVDSSSEPHKISIGSLVALGDGTKCQVVKHTRKYNGEPLYKVSPLKYKNPQVDVLKNRMSKRLKKVLLIINGEFAEEDLKIVELPNTQYAT